MTGDAVILGELTWPQIGTALTLLVPLGSTEQHGPHLPFDTDTRIAAAIAHQAAAGLADVIVAPALPYGASGEHAGFPGTLSIGTEVLHQVLVEIVRSSSDAVERTVFVNGHGGNIGGVNAAVDQLLTEGHNVLSWSPSVRGGDAHAGRTETSMMLALAPDAVDTSRAEPGNTEKLSTLMPTLVSSGVIGASPNGVLGDPAGACASEGEAIIAKLVEDLRGTLRR